jgi:hypothetical protein
LKEEYGEGTYSTAALCYCFKAMKEIPS